MALLADPVIASHVYNAHICTVIDTEYLSFPINGCDTCYDLLPKGYREHMGIGVLFTFVGFPTDQYGYYEV